MLASAIILAMALAGYAGYPWGLVLPGAACLTLGAWWAKVRQLHRQPRPAWSSKTRTYFVTGVVVDITLAALAFAAGRIVRAILT